MVSLVLDRARRRPVPPRRLVPVSPPERHAKLQVDRASVRFADTAGHVHALTDVTLTVQPGEFICLVGPSGCGKSTLLSLLAGFQRPDIGTVSHEGREVQGPGPDRAVIFQDPALFPWLTAEQNVAFALKHIRGRRDRSARAMAELRRVHLARFAGLRPHQLSGGMRQRVAIARALAMDPDVLLMDEPFAALDGQTREMLVQELQRLWMETGKTVVFVTHNVQEAVALGDRIVCMGSRPGRVIDEVDVRLARPREMGSADAALLARRVYAALRAEVIRIAEEESDFAEGAAGAGSGGGTPGLLRPGTGVMGDGI